MEKNLDDFEKYMKNNDDFAKKMIKIYLTSKKCEDYDYRRRKHVFLFDHDWLNKYVIPNMKLAKDWLIMEEILHSNGHYFGRFPVHKWRYNYITKESIEYNPGFDAYGEYFKGFKQKDWLQNCLYFSKDMVKYLIIGFISGNL